jgi:hypothetical protein
LVPDVTRNFFENRKTVFKLMAFNQYFREGLIGSPVTGKLIDGLLKGIGGLLNPAHLIEFISL